MSKQKSYLLYPLLIFVFLITLVSGNWSLTYAAGSDPSALPASSAFRLHKPGRLPLLRPCGPGCSGTANLSTPTRLAIMQPGERRSQPDSRGVVGLLPVGRVHPNRCSLFPRHCRGYDLPIASNPPPYPWKMITYADAFEVRMYSSACWLKIRHVET